MVGHGSQRRLRVVRQVPLGLRRDDDALDGQGAAGHLLGPGDLREQLLETGGVGSESCSTALSAPSTPSCGRRPRVEVGLAAQQLGGGDEGEEPDRLVPPERAT